MLKINDEQVMTDEQTELTSAIKKLQEQYYHPSPTVNHSSDL